MALALAGRNLFTKFTTTEDSTGERFGSTGAWVHVGSSTAAFSSADNSLLGTSTADGRQKPMDSSYPTRAVNVLTYRATFTTSEANLAWEEWEIKNTSATSTGTGSLLNRKLDSLGTKASTQSWQVTATVTVST